LSTFWVGRGSIECEETAAPKRRALLLRARKERYSAMIMKIITVALETWIYQFRLKKEIVRITKYLL